MPNTVTIDRHIAETQRRYPEAGGQFSALLRDVAFAAKMISNHVNRAGLVDILGGTGEENVQGEMVQKLDQYADDTLVRIVGRGGQVSALGSEERESLVEIERPLQGPYVLLYDPLDGSSNIDVNVSIGTIFSILRRVSDPAGPISMADALQPGFRQVAAGYVIYGSSTMFVYTAGNGVHGFTLDPSVGEFLLSHEDIRTPTRGATLSVNEGHAHKWSPAMREAVASLKTPGRTARYIGSLVADFHRNLLHGGVFLYPPAVDPETGAETPKLRLLYEASPLAMVVEQAGGYASDGVGGILRRQPQALHERVPLYIGSAEDVRDFEARLRAS